MVAYVFYSLGKFSSSKGGLRFLLNLILLFLHAVSLSLLNVCLVCMCLCVGVNGQTFNEVSSANLGCYRFSILRREVFNVLLF